MLLSIFIFTDNTKRKIKSPFHSEQPCNNENETEYTVRNGENNTQISFIILTRLTFSKILFLSIYIFLQTSILLLLQF